jgi:hypothetical protein
VLKKPKHGQNIQNIQNKPALLPYISRAYMAALGQRGKQEGGQVLNTCLPIGCMQPIAFCQPAQGVAASFFTGVISSKKLAFWLLLCYAIGRWVDIGSAARELPASRL